MSKKKKQTELTELNRRPLWPYTQAPREFCSTVNYDSTLPFEDSKDLDYSPAALSKSIDTLSMFRPHPDSAATDGSKTKTKSKDGAKDFKGDKIKNPKRVAAGRSNYLKQGYKPK